MISNTISLTSISILKQSVISWSSEQTPDFLLIQSGRVELYAQPLLSGKIAGPRIFLGTLPQGVLLPKVREHVQWELLLVPSSPDTLISYSYQHFNLSFEQAQRLALNFEPLISVFKQIKLTDNSEPDLVAILMSDSPLMSLQEWIHNCLNFIKFPPIYQELSDSSESDRIARQSAMIRMAAVLDPTILPHKSASNSLAALAFLVAKKQGIQPKEGTDKPKVDENIHTWSQRANVRLRKVALRTPWWQSDGTALLAFTEQTQQPVALLPRIGKGYFYRSENTTHAKEQELPVDSHFAHSLAPFAYSLHGRLPDKPLALSDILKFGWRGALNDLFSMLVAMLMAGLLGALLPAVIAYIFQNIIPTSEPNLLINFVVLIVILSSISIILRLSSDIASLRIEARLGNGLQSAFFDRLLRLPLSFFAEMTSGDLSNRLATIDMVRRSFSRVLIQLVTSTFFTLGAFATMFYFMPKAALIAVAVMVIVWVISGILAFYQVKSLYEGEQIEGNIIAMAVQLIQGITKLRLSGAEDRAFGLWGRGFAEMRSRLLRSQRLQMANQTMIAVFEVILLATVFAVLGYSENTGETKMIGVLALVAALVTFSGSGLSLGQAIAAAITLKPFAERARPLMNAVPEFHSSNANNSFKLKGNIEVVRLSFGYSESGPMVLRDLSFQVKSGQFVAVVGASGSGKSTLMRLLLAFDKPLSGSIFFDGYDQSSLDPLVLRRQIGVVLQNSRSMPGTLFENISVAHDCNLDEAWEAVRLAGLETDIRSMPMGMHTVLSEGNAALSGGQVQRLMLARALAGKPQLLFLDEATSALDNRTQAHITKALASSKATRFVIAHRLSTVKDADLILTMHEGKIVESGTFKELMALNGHFASLAQRQLV
jgi:NHLM bacteriocin system ABC transporter ATP-binding protein